MRFNPVATRLTTSLTAGLFTLILSMGGLNSICAGELRAGVAKADVTDCTAGPANDPLYVKALVLSEANTTAVIITVDAVAIGGIGPVGDDYLGKVRAGLEKELKIPAKNTIINASHCHGIVRGDIAELTIQAVKEAYAKLEPVKAGAGSGQENRIMENRRFILKDGSQSDVRHAYSVVDEKEVAAIGPVDPQIGLLKLEKLSGGTLAVVYNFACHPIQGVPGKGNTADFPGFASQVIEENLGEGSMAFFIQGCGGDINPIRYKDVNNPRDAETLGNLLGLSVLRGVRKIETKPGGELKTVQEKLTLPRSADYQERIKAMEARQDALLKSLTGTSLNFRNFLPLYLKYKVNPEFPSYDSHLYMREKVIGAHGLEKLDAENRANLEAYEKNIKTMEELTRLRTNMDLLKMHEAQTTKAGGKALEVEVTGLRVGEFQLVTFPGELTVQIGLNLKKAVNRPYAFVAGYTNGYIYYTPTAEQRKNKGYAQEDCDTLVAPEWQAIFEKKAMEVFRRLVAD